MKRFVLTLLLFLSACLPAMSTPIISTPVPPAEPTETSVPPTSQPESDITLRRGMNMGNMLEAPNEGEWGLFAKEEYFEAIKQAGFDFVRLPVRWNTHAEAEWPYAVDTAFFARIDEVVNWALQSDLTIIIDFHHYEEMMTDPWSNKDRFLGITKQVAEHYKDHPSNVLFELLNEPNDQLDASLWNEYSNEALKIVRESNPSRDVVIGPVNWNSPDWLSTLDLPDDPHLIGTFHYYSPFEFTHQGAEWNPDSEPWLGTTWDETEEQKAEVTRTFDLVSEWAAKKNIRVLLGEFGAYSRAPQDSRVRWTSFIAREAERHSFAWAYWEFASGFGAYDPNANVWRDDLLKALIP